ncbi:MAG: hypothetical protein ACRDSN_06305 [Pseudonocardiaceae bacterium]
MILERITTGWGDEKTEEGESSRATEGGLARVIVLESADLSAFTSLHSSVNRTLRRSPPAGRSGNW